MDYRDATIDCNSIDLTVYASSQIMEFSRTCSGTFLSAFVIRLFPLDFISSGRYDKQIGM